MSYQTHNITPRRDDKSQRGNKSNLAYFWIISGLTIWFVIVTFGMVWIFTSQSDGTDAMRKEVRNIISKSAFHLRTMHQSSFLSDGNLGNLSLHKPTTNNMKLTSEQKSNDKNSVTRPIFTDGDEKLLKKNNFPSVPKAIVKKPKQKLTVGIVMAMNATEQRQTLQELHDAEPPSDKAANAFILGAKNALLSGPQPGEPPIWPHPGNGDGKPGQMIEYTIAHKKVSIPYGYPSETIFILSASYKDPEVASTMARAFARAAHPERIYIGIHAQNDGGDTSPETDPIAGLKHAQVKCPQHPICSRLDHIGVSRQNYVRSEGPTIARAKAEFFYNNQTYVLGIDSHCQFIRGWDNIAIDMFKRLDNDYAIITTYPEGYDESKQGGDGSDDYDPAPISPVSTAICQTRRVNLHTTISFKHNFNSVVTPKDGSMRVAWFAAGFSFSRGHRILRVPYDYYTPYIFDGEETSMGVRAWTWGYDLYQPDRTVITHLYIGSGSKTRPVFWDSPDWGSQWPCQYSSILRFHKQLHIFDILHANDEGAKNRIPKLDMRDFSRYEVGPRRNVEDFWKWAEVDLQNNWGQFCTAPPPHELGKEIKKGREFCYSGNLCNKYAQPGGMPFVPWKPGTEKLEPWNWKLNNNNN